MRLNEPLRGFAGALAGPGSSGPGSYTLPIGPGHWHILFGNRSRPLLMPAGAYRVQRQGIRYFVGSRLKTWYANSLLAANSLLPAARLLPELRVPPDQRFPRAFGLPIEGSAQAAVQIGTAGPYQKASVLLMTESGDALAFAKVAMMPSADAMVHTEADWLRALETMSALVGQVPRLIARGTTPNGRHYLVTTLAPGTRTTRAFTPAHAQFLRALGRSRLTAMDFHSAPWVAELECSARDVAAYIENTAATTLRAAFHDCRRILRGRCGPLVVAHGDFAPWNIRLHDQRIFVFDWEYASRAANPLSDAINYLLIPRAVSGRGIGPRFLANAMHRAAGIAQQLYPEWRWNPPEVSALTLGYLLEVLLCYTKSQRQFDSTHPVMESYWHLLVRRRQWLVPS
ncbi:MAG TPA: phosphotransferase [Burkholderiales bacterium]|nr:phosphotransferase [Burkholderiales bacterium]